MNMNDLTRTVITDMDNRAILKILTARDYSTQRSIIEQLKAKRGIIIPQPTFSNKIRQNRLKVSELQSICELYGYELAIYPKK